MRSRRWSASSPACSLVVAACGDDDVDDTRRRRRPRDRWRRSRAATQSRPPAASTPATEPAGAGDDGGDDRASPAADRQPVADGDRDAVRDRRRRPGDRRRRTLNYPAEAAAKMTELSGVHPEHRGDRRLRARPRRHRRRRTRTCSSSSTRSASPIGTARRRSTLDDIYAQIEQLGAIDRTRRRGGRAGRPDAGRHRRGRSPAIPVLDEPLTYYHELDRRSSASPATRSSASCTRCSGCSNIADKAEGDAGPTRSSTPSSSSPPNPDLIFLADTKCCGETAETVAARPGWDEHHRGETGGVVEMDDDIASRWGPRIVDYVRQSSEPSPSSSPPSRLADVGPVGRRTDRRRHCRARAPWRVGWYPRPRRSSSWRCCSA